VKPKSLSHHKRKKGREQAREKKECQASSPGTERKRGKREKMSAIAS